jgi:hypothetical protein
VDKAKHLVTKLFGWMRGAHTGVRAAFAFPIGNLLSMVSKYGCGGCLATLSGGRFRTGSDTDGTGAVERPEMLRLVDAIMVFRLRSGPTRGG